LKYGAILIWQRRPDARHLTAAKPVSRSKNQTGRPNSAAKINKPANLKNRGENSPQEACLQEILNQRNGPFGHFQPMRVLFTILTIGLCISEFGQQFTAREAPTP
jgi:hypothetical protein